MGGQHTQESFQITHTKSLNLRVKILKLMEKNREKVLDGILSCVSNVVINIHPKFTNLALLKSDGEIVLFTLLPKQWVLPNKFLM